MKGMKNAAPRQLDLRLVFAVTVIVLVVVGVVIWFLLLPPLIS